MKRLFANIKICVLSRNNRNFDRLIRKFYILYNADKVKTNIDYTLFVKIK